MDTSRFRAVAGRVDGDPILVGVVALVVYSLHGFNGLLTRDLGVFTYGGEHVAKGVPPYVGIFNSVGPLSDAAPGLAIWLGHLVGLDPVLSSRLMFVVIAAACCAVLSVLARDVLGSRAAGFLAPAVFLCFERFVDLASDGPREKTLMVLFLLVAMVLVTRRRWFGAGVATALATLTWQPVFATAVAVTAVALLAGSGPRLRPAARFVAGGLVPLGVAVGYFAAQGALSTAFDGFVVVNVAYTHQPSALSHPASTWAMLWAGYAASLWLAVVGIVGLVVLSALAVPGVVRRTRRPVPARSVWLVAVGAGGVTSTAWTLAVINGAPDLFQVLPFAALGAAGLVVVPLRRLAPRRGWAPVAALAAAVTVVAGVQAAATRHDLLVAERADVSAVLSTVPASATVLSINAPEVLALAGRDNPTSLQVFDSAMEGYLAHDRPGGLTGYADWIARHRPTLLVLGKQHQRQWVRPVLARDYQQVGRGPDWTWWLSRSVGATRRTAVVAANAAVMRRAGMNPAVTRLHDHAAFRKGGANERATVPRPLGRSPGRSPRHRGLHGR